MKLTTRKGLQIGQMAKLAGVRPDTVRFYERDGLLARPERSPAGYRIYDEAALKRLRFIKQAQILGFSLDEIRRILSLRGRGKETCRCVIGMAEASLAETEAKLKELQKFRDALKANLVRWQQSSDQGGRIVAEFCALIETLFNDKKKSALRGTLVPAQEGPPSSFSIISVSGGYSRAVLK